MNISYKNVRWLLPGIIILGFFLRIYQLSIPFLTSEEARIASRGFLIAQTGQDELNRPFPLLFNSLVDYQLPVESYLVAGSELIFGKTDFGVRIPFIILGSILPLLIYKIGLRITRQTRVAIIASFLTAISPPLIFISKFPNQTVILLNLYSLFFYLIISKKINKIAFALICLILLFTSKITWFITLPFIFASLYYNGESTSFKKWHLTPFIFIALAFTIFLKIPQGKRSIIENNFSFFSDISLINGINQLKGQGLEIGINPILERVLFNKLHLLFSGLLNWFSQLSLESLFGSLNDLPTGVFINILIIPFLTGLVYLIKNNKKVLIYPLIFTFPAFFMQFGKYKELILLTIPFISIIIALGLSKLNKKVMYAIFIVVLLELFLNYSTVSFNEKITNSSRPSWVKEVIIDATAKQDRKIAISDDIIDSDITPYVQWLTNFKVDKFAEKIDYPYKFKRYNLGNITLLPSEQRFTSCSAFSDDIFYLSERDLNKIKNELNFKQENVYRNNLNNEVVFVISNICLN